MNYLAHAFLSFEHENILIGNFLADMVTPKESRWLDEKYQQGVVVHRLIDSTTDAHQAIQNINVLLRSRHRKYAPVISDVLLDYILAENWNDYSDKPLPTFIDDTLTTLASHWDEFPERVQPIISKMLKGRFLERYTTKEGLKFTFEKMQLHARYSSNFVDGLLDLEEFHNEITTNFKIFFPDIIQEIKSAIPNLPSLNDL